ncbi:Enamine deaminase RidA, house cleaning of reactive enamine intermediates, YjgF/YER057c/UK114 family [Pseudomonas sp. NFACC23-1]|uniref:RidA family protein n=1 Tax=unclassified Pseudomonas TaxID=196821 RepID=UPI00088C8C93|nr:MULTISPECIES: RidA family protein [unclassified Pseudomonas]SDB09144.1 Enamine deaminase RidA, house cleaning of reactive enamine intermediates, YjgF/YER057c/UK114 family [Pseudomonas sp. NFACC17-2]SEJ03652.1 Enamine deaminase RidA, house cleaning of reactive enamine intermediates, YjgF/YER057c/UK114 family [Pseudomonas sp. NFACC23-1]SFW38433.1 Enamine deaminase RidA, house cleaning of reactive enamine intermediates, YjgF/YER057c/UK114 family [Pseudomonas sp. NFACC16-2]
MATIQRFQSSARMSGVVRHGDLLYLSGQVPTDLQVGIQEQTQQVLAKIEALLSLAGSDKGQLVSAQIWLKDIDRDFALMNSVWDAWLPADSAPARATVQARLARPDVLVEIMVVAVKLASGG